MKTPPGCVSTDRTRRLLCLGHQELIGHLAALEIKPIRRSRYRYLSAADFGRLARHLGRDPDSQFSAQARREAARNREDARRILLARVAKARKGGDGITDADFDALYGETYAPTEAERRRRRRVGRRGSRAVT